MRHPNLQSFIKTLKCEAELHVVDDPETVKRVNAMWPKIFRGRRFD